MARKKPAKTRPKIDVADLKARASARAGFDVPEADVALAILSRDLEELYNTQDIEWEVWDKRTPINGVDPAVILGRPDYNGGEIYLVYIDGQLVMLQPHSPEGDGPISASAVNNVAAEHAAKIVHERVVDAFAEEVAATAIPPVPTFSLTDLETVLETSGRGVRRPGPGRRDPSGRPGRF